MKERARSPGREGILPDFLKSTPLSTAPPILANKLCHTSTSQSARSWHQQYLPFDGSDLVLRKCSVWCGHFLSTGRGLCFSGECSFWWTVLIESTICTAFYINFLLENPVISVLSVETFVEVINGTVSFIWFEVKRVFKRMSSSNGMLVWVESKRVLLSLYKVFCLKSIISF